MLWKLKNRIKSASGANQTGLPSRRAALRQALAGTAAAAALMHGEIARAAGIATGSAAFNHGVASGDPLSDRVVLWTALTPSAPGIYGVDWAVSLTPDMNHIVNQGHVKTDASKDYTVKVDVGSIQHSTTYWYQFTVNGVQSPVGRTKTLDNANDPKTSLVKLAAFTCSEFEWGYFNAYDDASKRDDLDAIVFLGDFIYEYAPNEYVTTAAALGLAAQPRAAQLNPTYDIVLLADYRLRYRTYRSDPNLQALCTKNPAIGVWDDHEFADNANRLGAFNHHPATQGSWNARKMAAIQAYYEWNPIREPAHKAPRFDSQGTPAPIYRSFRFGRLLELIMLDTRIIGRDPSFEDPTKEIATSALYGVYSNPGADYSFPNDLNPDGSKRSLLGATQEQWVDSQLANSRQTWQVIGNQVLYRYGVTPNIALLPQAEQTATFNLLTQLFGAQTAQTFVALGAQGLPSPAEQDDWTGYPSAKSRFLQSLAKARNPVLITGDSHNAWASNIGSLGGSPVAVEFGTTSVTSPGFEQTIVTTTPADSAMIYVQSSQNGAFFKDRTVWADLSRRGYLVLTATQTSIQADFHFVSTVFAPTYSTDVKSWQVQAGQKVISAV